MRGMKNPPGRGPGLARCSLSLSFVTSKCHFSATSTRGCTSCSARGCIFFMQLFSVAMIQRVHEELAEFFGDSLSRQREYSPELAGAVGESTSNPVGIPCA